MKKIIIIMISILTIVVTFFLFTDMNKEVENDIWSYKTVEITTPLKSNEYFISSNIETYTTGVYEDGFKIYRYTPMENFKTELYHNSRIDNVVYTQYINDDLYIGITYMEDEDYVFTLDVVTKDGTTQRVYEETVKKRPIISSSGSFILMNLETANESTYTSKIVTYNLNTKEVSTDIETSYTVSNDGLYTGDIIMYMNQNVDGYIYQVLTYNNELFESDGVSHIYQYKDGTSTEIFSFDEQHFFILGDKNALVRSVYDDTGMSENTGFITSDEEISINNVHPGRDIIDGYPIDDNTYIFNNVEYMYRYTVDSNTLEEKQYAKSDTITYSSVNYAITKNGLALSWISIDDDIQTVYYYEPTVDSKARQ